MTARAELPTRLLTAVLLTLALLVGVVAGYSPPVAIGLTLGLVFLGVAMTNLTAGICLFALLTFLDTVLPTEGAGGAFSVPKLLGLVLMISWLALVTVGEREHRERLFSHSGFLLVLFMLLGWVLLSAAWAEDTGAVVESLTRWLPNVLLFLIVFAGVRTREQLLWVLGAFVAGALVSAIYGMVVPAPARDFGRLSGAGGDPNETAAALVAGAAIAAALAAVLRGKPILRLASAAVVPLAAFACFLTVSRGGLVAFGAALIASIAMAGRRRGAAIGLALAGAVVAVGYFALFAPAAARERVTESNGGTGRLDIWTVGWRMVEGAPLQGVGAGNFTVVSIHYLLEPGALLRDDFIVDVPKVAHNTYLEVLAELGIVGLTLFLIVIVFSIACAVRAARYAEQIGDAQMDIIARAVVVALVALLAAYAFISREYSKQLWLLLALCPVLLEIVRANGRSAQPPR
ncbi:MAG: O-antigen ligase family protein [Thermoleophilaceae bacterium]|nr:O-antigen ligase family protein [Thermoleophilaceae bacterium]